MSSGSANHAVDPGGIDGDSRVKIFTGRTRCVRRQKFDLLASSN